MRACARSIGGVLILSMTHGLVCGASAWTIRAGENLFPTKKGSSWTFSGTAGSQKLKMTAEITSSTTSGGSSTVIMLWTQNGRSVQEETYTVSQGQVVRVKAGAGGAMQSSPPVPVIKYPMAVGKSWSWKGAELVGSMRIPASAQLKVAAKEAVKTAAGTFNAYRVDMKVTTSVQGQNVTATNSYWFAAGVGMVKQSAIVNIPGGKPLVVTAALEKYEIK